MISFCFWINFWSLFQVQSYLPLGIVNYGVSKHYAGFMVSDRCPLGYLCLSKPVNICGFPQWVVLSPRLQKNPVWNQGFRFFSRSIGWSDPWSKKWWVIFCNDGSKYIKLTTVDIWVEYFTYTLTQTQTLVCIYVYTVNHVLSGHSKKKTNYRLMQVRSIAE